MTGFPVLEGFVLGWKTLCDTGDGEVFFRGMMPSIYGPEFIQKNREMLDLKPPKFSQILADRIPDAEYITLPGCGHVAIFEKPKKLESAISGFVLKHC
ncbi:MAG: hypothetical protein IK016_10460 [Lachnospiraceae bacterium]|nr:hypothetical protein [Lachnospiraceae bacterium]